MNNWNILGSNPQIEQEIAEQERIMREIRIKNAKSIKDRNKVRINTSYLKDQIEFVEEYPLEETEEDRNLRKIYKYYCPICLRYFNHILISDCCNNYICRLCIGWQAKKAKKDENYCIKCSHCYKENFRLVDVDLNDKEIKYYTDTPFKCLQRSMQKELLDDSDKQDHHQLEDLKTPRDFEGQVDKINGFL
jgi:predicted ATP-dependent protease